MKNINDIDFEALSEEERAAVLQIMNEIADKGSSDKYTDILYQDYKEIPVDILTFIKDPRYLGKAWHLSDGECKLYPYWEDKLQELFPDNISTSVNNFILSGARGLGKSEIAVTVMAYLMYRVMCLKNPLEYFGLKPTERIAFSFMNITEALAYDIGVSKFQNTIQMSPWFMERGTLSGKKELVWNPPPYINIIIGSQPRHVIGQACLTGDTKILTTEGIRSLSELEGKKIRVFNFDYETGNLSASDECTVQVTRTSDELIDLNMEDGTTITCTPDHKFLLKTGVYKEAQYLTTEDDIAEFTPYGYVYKTTNTLNNKVYIGQKHSSVFLGDQYLGSGKLIQRAIVKYGKDNFTVELLCFCDSKKSLDNCEIEYIKKYNSTDLTVGYNIAKGGQGGNLGDAVNAKISQALRNKENRFTLKGYTSYIDEKGKIKYRLRTEEVPASWRKGNNASGKIRITNGVCEKVVDKNEPIPEGWRRGTLRYGTKLSQETRLNMSKAQKLRSKDTFIGYNKGRIWITDGITSKLVCPDDEIPEGWKRGNVYTAGHHDMSKYYSESAKEQRLNNSKSKSGKNNSMYKKGYKVAGGNNGHATIRYFYEEQTFECRKDLLSYLNTKGIKISSQDIANFVKNNKISSKYSDILSKITWEKK